MYSKQTECVHIRQRHQGVNTSIYTSTASRYMGYEEILYPRNFNTENQKTIAEKLCRLEKGEAGIKLRSGRSYERQFKFYKR